MGRRFETGLKPPKAKWVGGSAPRLRAHQVNLDALSEGVLSFLVTFHDEAALDARAPLEAPRGAHAVLWVDDFWRGVDMASEAVESIVNRWRSVRTQEIDDPSRAQAVSVILDGIVQATLMLVEAELTHGQVLDEVSETADHDLADVLIDALDNIAVTGDADGLGIAWNDGEIDADRMEEA